LGGIDISKKELQKLIKKGEKTGSLSFAELNDAISDDLKSLDQIEDVVIQFKKLGIKLVDKEKEKIKKKTTVKKKINTANKKNKTATKTAKTTTKKSKATTDPVKMYLKEMGLVTLLSREGEIKIAKKIELGERNILRAMLDCPLTIVTIFLYGDKMEQKSMRPKHVLRDVDEGDGIVDEASKQAKFLNSLKIIKKILEISLFGLQKLKNLSQNVLKLLKLKARPCWINYLRKRNL
jgi:RNA polymerase primary sigma factor